MVNQSLVERLYKLAALQYSPEPSSAGSSPLADFEQIIEFFSVLQQLPITGDNNVPPCAVLGDLRSDEVVTSQTVNAALDNAAQSHQSYFVVPRVM